MATHLRRDLEPRWVSWYVARKYPRDIVKLRCPLGPIPDALLEAVGEAKGIKMYRPWRPEVDALIIMPGTVELIEAKIFKYMDGLSKLPVYQSLVPLTPELRAWKDLPTRMLLLIPAEIDWVKTAAARTGVNVSTEAPDYIKQVWEERDKYWTKPFMEQREKRKEVLRKMGYE